MASIPSLLKQQETVHALLKKGRKTIQPVLEQLANQPIVAGTVEFLGRDDILATLGVIATGALIMEPQATADLQKAVTGLQQALSSPEPVQWIVEDYKQHLHEALRMQGIVGTLKAISTLGIIGAYGRIQEYITKHKKIRNEYAETRQLQFGTLHTPLRKQKQPIDTGYTIETGQKWKGKDRDKEIPYSQLTTHTPQISHPEGLKNKIKTWFTGKFGRTPITDPALAQQRYNLIVAQQEARYALNANRGVAKPVEEQEIAIYQLTPDGRIQTTNGELLIVQPIQQIQVETPQTRQIYLDQILTKTPYINTQTRTKADRLNTLVETYGIEAKSKTATQIADEFGVSYSTGRRYKQWLTNNNQVPNTSRTETPHISNISVLHAA